MTEVSATRSNRRLYARHACHFTVRYKVGKDWHPATAMDLSGRGCRLRLGEDLARNLPVKVAFESPPIEGGGTLEVEVAGHVIWSRREGLSYQAGIHFSETPDSLDRILSTVA